MSRISDKFDQLRKEGQKGFIPFVTAGDPSLDASKSIVLKLAALGADIIELGVPFSDPMADGPTIQRSSGRALSAGVRLEAVLELAADLRREIEVPIVLFSYFNPIFRMGLDKFAEAAASAGVDGVLLTDVIGAEAATIQTGLDSAGIDLISLVAPTTSDERLDDICRRGRGFIYAVSRAGVTGAPSDPGGVAQLVNRIRARTTLPVAVGFGVSTREHIESVWRWADAAVVGSALVAEIEKSADPVIDVERFVRSILPRFANQGARL
jgi:tryptophan synthase alpha chain